MSESDELKKRQLRLSLNEIYGKSGRGFTGQRYEEWTTKNPPPTDTSSSYPSDRKTHEWSEDFAKTHSPSRAKLLRLLWDMEWHHHSELRVAGVRYSARLLELKRLGYWIASALLLNGESGKRYCLMSRTPTFPKKRQIKVFLDPQDVAFLLFHKADHLPANTLEQLDHAYARYVDNINKL